jgi:glutamate-1-semialdehyde aminotransferase
MDMSLIIKWWSFAGRETFMVQIEDSEKVYFHEKFDTLEAAMAAGAAAFKAARESVQQTLPS